MKGVKLEFAKIELSLAKINQNNIILIYIDQNNVILVY